MKEFCCGEVVPGCTTEFEGETDESILQQVAIHAREDHGMEEVSPQLVDQVLAGIHDRQPR